MSFTLTLSKGAKKDAAKQALAQQVLALLFAGSAEKAMRMMVATSYLGKFCVQSYA